MDVRWWKKRTKKQAYEVKGENRGEHARMLSFSVCFDVVGSRVVYPGVKKGKKSRDEDSHLSLYLSLSPSRTTIVGAYRGHV